LELGAYLDRIRFEGAARPDLDTLRRLHLAHQHAVPFENLDVQLRRPVVLDVEPNYDKIVRRRRGGGCYEMNCVMGWALKEIGFDVMRMSAGVMRERAGNAQLGNHLCLLMRRTLTKCWSTLLTSSSHRSEAVSAWMFPKPQRCGLPSAPVTTRYSPSQAAEGAAADCGPDRTRNVLAHRRMRHSWSTTRLDQSQVLVSWRQRTSARVAHQLQL